MIDDEFAAQGAEVLPQWLTETLHPIFHLTNTPDTSTSTQRKTTLFQAVLFLAANLDLVLVFWTKMVLSFSQILVTSTCDSFSPVLVDENSNSFSQFK